MSARERPSVGICARVNTRVSRVIKWKNMNSVVNVNHIIEIKTNKYRSVKRKNNNNKMAKKKKEKSAIVFHLVANTNTQG